MNKTGSLTPAIVAGVIGGIFIDVFLAIVLHTSPIGIWQYVASSVVGKVAYTSPVYALLGFVLHFITSIVWAVIYLYAFGAIGQLKNWILGAIVWGIVVDTAMAVILTIRVGVPYLATVEQGLLGHIVFYALPVAWYIARSVRTTA